MLTLREYFDLMRHYSMCPARRPVYGLAILGFVAVAAQTGATYLVATEQMLFGVSAAAVVAVMFFLALGMRRNPLAQGFPTAAAAAVGFIYIVIPLAMLVNLRQQGSGAFLILYLLIVVWVGDTVAFYTGRAFGRQGVRRQQPQGRRTVQDDEIIVLQDLLIVLTQN